MITGMLISFAAAFGQDKQINLDHIYREGTFSARTVSGLRSMNDGLHYTTMEMSKEIKKWSYQTGEEVEVLFSTDGLAEKEFENFSDYVFSPDEKKILFTTGREQIYRHSFKAGYFVWDIESGRLRPLSMNGKQQIATFSPDGQKVAFVRENNLFYSDLDSGQEVSGHI
jgi:dipeptidyl-peptidase 4